MQLRYNETASTPRPLQGTDVSTTTQAGQMQITCHVKLCRHMYVIMYVYMYIYIIFNSVHLRNHFIIQGNYTATCFDYRLVILRPILSIVSQDAMHTLGSVRMTNL